MSHNKPTTKRTTMIIADSTPSKISINSIKENIDLSEEGVIFKRYPGHTAEEIAFYAPKPLSDIAPDQVVVIAGTNSLTRSIHQNGVVDEYEVVDGILEIARAARSYGAKKVYVSSILVRRGNEYRRIVAKVNDLLYMACLAEHFVYMDQREITLAHLESDGLHPNYHGSAILKRNILSVFDTSSSDYMNVRKQPDHVPH